MLPEDVNRSVGGENLFTGGFGTRTTLKRIFWSNRSSRSKPQPLPRTGQGQVRSGQARSGRVRPGQVRSGQVRSGQVMWFRHFYFILEQQKLFGTSSFLLHFYRSSLEHVHFYLCSGWHIAVKMHMSMLRLAFCFGNAHFYVPDGILLWKCIFLCFRMAFVFWKCT